MSNAERRRSEIDESGSYRQVIVEALTWAVPAFDATDGQRITVGPDGAALPDDASDN